MAETSVDPHLPDITNSLVCNLNNIPSPRNSNVEKNLDIMKPTYSRHINLVSPLTLHYIKVLL